MQTKRFKKLIFIIIFTFSISNYSQTLEVVTNLENKYQECLDNGNGMKECAEKFYSTSDSLLNIPYKNLKLKMNLTEQNSLRIEQRNWLKKRDTYFEKAYDDTIKDYGNFPESQDFKMILIDKQSDFVIKRVKELIKRRNNIK